MLKYFNRYWWKYIWDADTIYQVHSPFLFEFATKIWTPVSGKSWSESVLKTDKSGPLKNSKTLAWIYHLSSRYRIENLLLVSGTPLEQLLLEENFIRRINNAIPQTENLSLYRIIEPKNTSPNNYAAQVNFTLGVFPATMLQGKIILSIVNQTGPSLFLVEKIHENHKQYHRWCGIIKNSMFNFSVELYNFGLVFYHPVNQTPEHITLIPWPRKPWKLISF